MKLLENHVLLMFIYAVAVGIFFAFLWRDNPRERIRFFLVVSISLFVGGLVLAWIMFPFPFE